jgi:hypothetical protein
MEPQIINQEILLFTGSSFCNRQFCKRDDNDGNNSKHSSMEELESMLMGYCKRYSLSWLVILCTG